MTAGIIRKVHPIWDARRLWSLADMINFYLGRFILSRQLLWQELIGASSEAFKGQNRQIPESQRPRIEQHIKGAIRECVAALQLEQANWTSIHLENLLNNYEYQPVTWGRLDELLRRLWDDLDIGLAGEYFFHYTRDDAKLVLSVDENWKDIIASFPSARPEIVAAVDCYAIGHNTACVFHMMRVAECGLRMIGKERGIRRVGRNKPIEWGTWQDVFQAIEGKLKAIRQATPGPKRDAALAFYDTALSDLRALQGNYRDPTMHFRDSYDRGQAYSAMFRVKNLMQTISTKLREDRVRKIAWGL